MNNDQIAAPTTGELIRSLKEHAHWSEFLHRKFGVASKESQDAQEQIVTMLRTSAERLAELEKDSRRLTHLLAHVFEDQPNEFRFTFFFEKNELDDMRKAIDVDQGVF